MLQKKWNTPQERQPAPLPERYLASFPPPIQRLAQRVRSLVKQALPDSTEQVKLGWRLIGLYIPGQVQPVYFGFIIPHTDYVTLGFTFGVLVNDPTHLLLGAEENLMRVRYRTLRTAKDIRPAIFTAILQQAAEIALLPAPLRSELLSRARRRMGE